MQAQNLLGDFLRSRRERLSPDALGLATLRRRRTPGLRREEVAERAGIGVDWYIRLEQGRAESPSATTIDALASASRRRSMRICAPSLACPRAAPSCARPCPTPSCASS
jgi:transcriptional regulator with XRE-family HTH domain